MNQVPRLVGTGINYNPRIMASAICTCLSNGSGFWCFLFHSFCKKCLRSAADRCGKKCPKCRQLIRYSNSIEICKYEVFFVAKYLVIMQQWEILHSKHSPLEHYSAAVSPRS